MESFIYYIHKIFQKTNIMESFIYYIRKIFQKTNISYLLIRTQTCEYQGVRNVSFSENSANVINEGSLCS